MRASTQSFGSLISRWLTSLWALQHCQVQQVESSVILYNSVISSVGSEGWPLAVDLFSQLRIGGLECTSITYNAMAGAWRRAWWNLKEMQQMQLERSVVSYSTLTSSWRGALEILAELSHQELPPNIISFTSAITKQRWKRALQLYISCWRKQVGRWGSEMECRVSDDRNQLNQMDNLKCVDPLE